MVSPFLFSLHLFLKNVSFGALFSARDQSPQEQVIITVREFKKVPDQKMFPEKVFPMKKIETTDGRYMFDKKFLGKIQFF